jgi:hypothetical protein
MKEVERNQRPSLLDDIGRICPELEPKIAGIRPPPAGPYAAAQLYPWLCSVSVTILGIVLHLGRRALQEVLDAHLDGLDRPEVDVVGAERPCPCTKCGSPLWHYNGRERRKKDFLSIFGLVNLWRYQAECSHCARTFYPLDDILGIPSSPKLFPVLQQIVIFLGTHLPFREAAEVLRLTLGISLSAEVIRAAVRAVGEAVTIRHELGDWEPEIGLFRLAATETDSSLVLETALDGAMVPLNEKPKEETNSHKEARSMSLRLKDAKGKVLARLIISRLTDLPLFLTAMGTLLMKCRESLPDLKVVLAGDGADWIWQFAKDHQITRTVLDWFHLLGYYLKLVEACAFGKSSPRRKRLQRIKDALWEGRAGDALRELRGFRCRNAAERKAKNDLVRYIENHREHIINYRWNKQRKRMVGSGAVEGGQKKSIHDRLKCAGMRWSQVGADYTMAARSSELNNTIEYDICNANLAA